MKKIIGTVLAAVVLCAGFASCSGGADSDVSGGSAFQKSNEITVISREDGSGTRGAFIELFGVEVKDSSGNKSDKTTKEATITSKTDVMLTSVAGDEYAIGYVSLGSLNNSVKALQIDGVAATTENIKSGAYKISRPFKIATKGEPAGLAKDFISFIMSKEGQDVIANGYIKVDDNAAAYAGSKPEGKISVGGSSSVAPIMEKLKEAYAKINPAATIEIQQSDSTAGLKGALDGTFDIGMASRDLKDSEKETLTDTAIALDGIAVIVNNRNSFDTLTSAQVKEIYTGKITSWDELDA